MRNSSFLTQRLFCALFIICMVHLSAAQNLKLTDFAVWGGGAAPNPFNAAQGVSITDAANIQGNIGSNHLISINNNLVLKGSIYSGNRISFNDFANITGNLFANRIGTTA